MKKVNFNGQPFHFIGIGGIGMSALAYILAKRNLPIPPMLKHSLTRYTAPVLGVCKTAKSSEFFSFCGKFLLLMHRDLVPYTSGWFFLQQMKYHY